MAGLSGLRRRKSVWDKGAGFFLPGRLMLGKFWKTERTQSIKRYKLFLAVASENRIGFSNDFLVLPATLYKKFLEL